MDLHDILNNSKAAGVFNVIMYITPETHGAFMLLHQAQPWAHIHDMLLHDRRISALPKGSVPRLESTSSRRGNTLVVAMRACGVANPTLLALPAPCEL